MAPRWRRTERMPEATNTHDEIVAHHDKLLIVDFGSQVTQLIARRVREAGVYCEIHPFQNAARAFDELQPKAVILSGGPASVTTDGSPRAPEAVFASGVPVLGICYGQHDHGRAAWRRRRKRSPPRNSAARRCGSASATAPLFAGCVWTKGETNYAVWMSHGDRITQLPAGFARIESGLAPTRPTPPSRATKRRRYLHA